MSEHVTPRLVHVIVQPVFVLDDGDNVSLFEQEPILVKAADWPTYPMRFADEVEAWTERLNSGANT